MIPYGHTCRGQWTGEGDVDWVFVLQFPADSCHYERAAIVSVYVLETAVDCYPWDHLSQNWFNALCLFPFTLIAQTAGFTPNKSCKAELVALIFNILILKVAVNSCSLLFLNSAVTSPKRSFHCTWEIVRLSSWNAVQRPVRLKTKKNWFQRLHLTWF